MPLFPIPPLVFGIIADRLWKKELFRVILAVFFLLIFTINAKFFFSQTPAPDFVPYKLQREIAEFIVTDAKATTFKLRRVGPYDYFSEDYSQNYRYLLWINGNEPISSGELTYTIYEDTSKLPSQGEVKWFSNVAVVKEVK